MRPKCGLECILAEQNYVLAFCEGFCGPNTARMGYFSLADGDGFHFWPWHGFPQSQLGLKI